LNALIDVLFVSTHMARFLELVAGGLATARKVPAVANRE
jgi:hypothetical protein